MNLKRLRTLAGLAVTDQRVLVRADLNVPLKDGKVVDATRLVRLLPGLEDLARRGARVILISHLGRPKGGRDNNLSLKPVAEELGRLLGRTIVFASDCVGEPAETAAASLKAGQIAVLENLRFHAGEEKNDLAFARRLAGLADIFLNDAFSAAHRAHASTAALAGLLPAFAGPLLMEEVNALQSVLETPRRPVAAVIGGAKVSSKISLLKNLLAKVDKLIIAGGMANTFLLAEGIAVGTSLAEPDLAATALDIISAARERATELILPQDLVVAEKLAGGAQSRVVGVRETPSDRMILDIGPSTVARLSGDLRQSHTLLWNGPLGAFENAPFGEGTFALAREAGRLARAGKLTAVAGGGDTVAALNAAGVTEQFSYVSTAGGAFLEWLEGRDLPGIAALAAAAP
jgi:phosphoglycerate kinase